MNLKILKVGIKEIDILIAWRMEVLHEVFGIPEDAPTAELERANRKYYEKEIPTEGHIACFAELGGENVGCGGVCLYNEMPSPDNSSGRCAYIMNVYTRPGCRHLGIGGKIVSWLIDQSKARGVDKIYLEASEDGKPLYAELGFKPMENYMKLV